MATPTMPADQSADHQPARPAPGEDGVEQGQPDRHRGDEHRSDARRDVQLREHDAAVAAEEEQRADDERRPPVRAGRSLDRLRAASDARVGDERAEHEQSGGGDTRTPAASSGGRVSIIIAMPR